MRRTLIILLLFLSVATAQGQLNMFLRGSALVEADSFLDVHPGAVAAYSLTYLTSSYFGHDVIQVRRSSDNATQGFTPEEITDGTLTAFCGAGNGLITTWYDQVGTYDLTQSTTSLQPTIVASGVLVTSGGLPAIQFSNHRLINAALSLSQPETIFTIAELISDDGTWLYWDSFDDVVHYTGRGNVPSNYTRLNAPNNFIGPGPIVTGRNLLYALTNSTASAVGLNGVAPTVGNAGTNGFSGISVGHIRGNPTVLNAAYNFVGKYQELIIYNSNEAANKAAIETHRNNYYGIY